MQKEVYRSQGGREHGNKEKTYKEFSDGNMARWMGGRKRAKVGCGREPEGLTGEKAKRRVGRKMQEICGEEEIQDEIGQGKSQNRKERIGGRDGSLEGWGNEKNRLQKEREEKGRKGKGREGRQQGRTEERKKQVERNQESQKKGIKQKEDEKNKEEEEKKAQERK